MFTLKPIFSNSLNLPVLTSLSLKYFAFAPSEYIFGCVTVDPFSVFKMLNTLIIDCRIVLNAQHLCISSAFLIKNSPSAKSSSIDTVVMMPLPSSQISAHLDPKLPPHLVEEFLETMMFLALPRLPLLSSVWSATMRENNHAKAEKRCGSNSWSNTTLLNSITLIMKY
ncbi:unnamed protein product [Trifolium pratense]|uniref:Uncharacterized protein n=1 Tax=Trifolium pratense TaxID=57577 RepID=A0ACB0JEJ3_TRIPR|nr:unnamed protein product [Trifolium pratense]